MTRTSYAVALGSNRRGLHGSPADTIRAAAHAIGARRLSRIRTTPALGPAGRAFANAVALVESEGDPADLLARLKAVERSFGRRAGKRWGPRILDLDIILWSGGPYEAAGLVVPHPAFRERRFVLEPLAELAADWRDPISGRSIRQLLARLRHRRG
jgi:2-amino-4-hydroxy-6-hydroxymethyldihydropteridine diphosphokinase